MTLEDVIRRHVHLPYRANSGGWFPVLCRVCHDHGRKGPRAGFRFENGGNGVGYHCFNCGHTGSYDPEQHKYFTKDFKTIIQSFSIPEDDCNQVLLDNLGKEGIQARNDERKRIIDYEPKEIALPKNFYKLTDDSADDVAQYAIEYLRDERHINWTDHEWYLSKPTGANDDRWFGRLVIPTFKDDKLIYYSGRDLTGMRPRKYINVNVERDNVLYGYENIMADSNSPIYVVEGWFDAFLIKGVAVFGRTLRPGQIYWLNRSRRPKVVIPDREGEGQDLALQALKLGWSVSTPDIGDAKDITDAIGKYGLLYTLKTIRDNTADGILGELNVEMYCK